MKNKIVSFPDLMDYIKVDFNTGCWNWKRFITVDGYGRVSFYGKQRLAHRISMFLYGLMPEDKFNDPSVIVMHQCDNPSCISPDHLKIGTQEENVHDCIRKKRRWKNK